MPTRISKINRIIITIRIQIQSIRRFGIDILSSVRRNESAPFGAVISCIEVVKFGFGIVVITTVSDRVKRCKIAILSINDFAVAPCIIGVLYLLFTVCVVDSNDIALQITVVVIQLRVLNDINYIILTNKGFVKYSAEKRPITAKMTVDFCFRAVKNPPRAFLLI